MMVKVGGHTAPDDGATSQWTLFDNCWDVSYDNTWQTIPEGTALDTGIMELRGWDAEHLHVYHGMTLTDAPGGGRGVIGRLLRWQDPQGMHILFTDAPEVYILNDAGDTLERL